MRGQGVKILSLVSKEARLNDYLLPVVKEEDDDEKYEGAIVVDPTPGIYLDEPVSVLDYASPISQFHDFSKYMSYINSDG